MTEAARCEVEVAVYESVRAVGAVYARRELESGVGRSKVYSIHASRWPSVTSTNMLCLGYSLPNDTVYSDVQ